MNVFEKAAVDVASAVFVFGVDVVSAVGSLVVNLIKAFPG